jgi:threonine dehydrogenase-like Zn-dependent dehydrogenase
VRSIVFRAPGNLLLEERPVPVPAAGEVRLRVDLAGICSTDAHIYQGHFKVRPPRVLGHELVGSVEAVAPDVPASWLGQVCGVSPARFCGECAACRQGYPELCENFECLGNTQDGAFAEYTLVRADQLIPLNGLPAETAVWLEPLACVLHALQVAEAGRREAILVVGAGVLGKLMLMAIRATTQARLAVVDPNAAKIRQALELGAQAGWVIPRAGPTPQIAGQIREWAPGGPQAILETSGTVIAIERAVDWAGPGAMLVLFGVPDPAARACLAPGALFAKEIKVCAAAGMTPPAFQQALDLLRLGRLDPRGLAAKQVDLAAVPQLFAGGAFMQSGKVLVRPAGEEP